MSDRILDTSRTIKIKTARGVLTIEPGGRIEGLWRLVARELIAGEKVRELAGSKRKPVPRSTLIYWRKRSGFPEPVVTVKEGGRAVELWSRTQVQDWLARHAAHRRFIETGQLDPE